MGTPSSFAVSEPPVAPAPTPTVAAPSGLPPVTKFTDITPEHLADLRKKLDAQTAAIKKQSGTRGVKEFQEQNKEFRDQNKFLMEQSKDANAIDQNTPASFASAEAVLSPFGTTGQAALNKLQAAHPDGRIPKSILNETVTALVGSTKSDYYGGMNTIREQNLRRGLSNDAMKALQPTKDQVDRINSIGRAKPLVGQMLSQLDGGDPRQMRELATTMDRVIKGGGTSAQSQIEELVPQTARGKFAHWLEWFNNDPHGTDQQAFIKRYAETLRREEGAIQDQIRNNAHAKSGALRLLQENYPEDYQAQLNAVLKNPQYDPTQSAPTPGVDTAQPKTVTSQPEYDALPSGATYLANGVLHRKK
jgi:hypothetical protein